MEKETSALESTYNFAKDVKAIIFVDNLCGENLVLIIPVLDKNWKLVCNIANNDLLQNGEPFRMGITIPSNIPFEKQTLIFTLKSISDESNQLQGYIRVFN
jgi:hypothetical protein